MFCYTIVLAYILILADLFLVLTINLVIYLEINDTLKDYAHCFVDSCIDLLFIKYISFV